MAYYTNEFSLRATFADKEVSALIADADGTGDEVRLEKAAKRAFDEINMYLGSAGYQLPLEFDAFPDGEPTEPLTNPLNGVVQAISDDFTAYYLAKSADLMKDVYAKGYAEGLLLLKGLVNGSLLLDLARTDPATGNGGVYVVARPQVFTNNMQPQTQYNLWPLK